MNSNERVQLIELRLKKIRNQILQQQNLIGDLRSKNNQLQVELDELKKSNFELRNQIKIANMANQLSNEQLQSRQLKLEIDKYIKEVDSVIEALKNME